MVQNFLDGMYVWSINGMEGIQNDAYVGMFETSHGAVRYFDKHIDGQGQWELYQITFQDGVLALAPVTFAQAS